MTMNPGFATHLVIIADPFPHSRCGCKRRGGFSDRQTCIRRRVVTDELINFESRSFRKGNSVLLRGAEGKSGLAAGNWFNEMVSGVFVMDHGGNELLQSMGRVRIPDPEGGPEGNGWWVKVLGDIVPGRVSDIRMMRKGRSVAWVTLSDKGARGERVDTSGPTIAEMVRSSLDISLVRGFLLPDSMTDLKGLLMDLALFQKVDLILTTGGTGVGPRDISPEATSAVVEKRLPGFEQVMTAGSRAKTPHGMISRAVVGTLGSSLIINLPGSPKAVSENLASVLPAVEHTLAKLQGDPSDCARHG